MKMEQPRSLPSWCIWLLANLPCFSLSTPPPLPSYHLLWSQDKLSKLKSNALVKNCCWLLPNQEKIGPLCHTLGASRLLASAALCSLLLAKRPSLCPVETHFPHGLLHSSAWLLSWPGHPPASKIKASLTSQLQHPPSLSLSPGGCHWFPLHSTLHAGGGRHGIDRWHGILRRAGLEPNNEESQILSLASPHLFCPSTEFTVVSFYITYIP